MLQSLNTIDATFEAAAEELRKTRMVACVEAYPLCPARMGSRAIKEYFQTHPYEFVTNDGRNVYYSQDNIVRAYQELNQSISGVDARDYLTREYAHLFLQHSRLRRYYNKDEIKANTFAVACEIEACRTKGISAQRVCYQTSATDELFKCAKDAKYLRQIYQALVDEYGDEIEQFAEQQKGNNQNGDGESSDQSGDNGRSGDDSGNDDKQRNDDSQRGGSVRSDGDDNSNSSGGGDSGSDGDDGGENGNGNRPDEGGQSTSPRETGANSQRDSDSNLGEQSSGQQSAKQQQSSASSGAGSGHQEQSQKDSGQHQRNSQLSQSNGGKLTDEQKERLAKTFARAEDKLSPTDGDDQMLQDFGIEPGEVSETTDLQSLIEVTYERWRDKQLKKQLAKLKSAIEGQVSRRKYSTYARPSRRACTANGLLTKGRKKELVGQPTILVALDGSGSMSAQRIRDLTHCIGNIFDDLGRPKKGCHICMFDDEVLMCEPMRKWREVCKKYRSYGGTNYNCVLKLANKLGVDVVIEVGDGEGDLTWGYRRNNALAVFKENNRRWIDLLVQHDEYQLNTALDHVASDANNSGIQRELICLDEKLSITLSDIERRRKNY